MPGSRRALYAGADGAAGGPHFSTHRGNSFSLSESLARVPTYTQVKPRRVPGIGGIAELAARLGGTHVGRRVGLWTLGAGRWARVDGTSRENLFWRRGASGEGGRGGRRGEAPAACV